MGWPLAVVIVAQPITLRTAHRPTGPNYHCLTEPRPLSPARYGTSVGPESRDSLSTLAARSHSANEKGHPYRVALYQLGWTA